jgi:hypothetical protein
VGLGSDAPIGPIREELTVRLSIESPNTVRRLTIPVRGYVQGDVSYHPKAIFWGTVGLEAPRAEIMITANSDSGVGIGTVRSEKGLVKILNTDCAAGRARVCVELNDSVADGFASDAVIITTSSKDMPVIRIPVYVTVRRKSAQQPSSGRSAEVPRDHSDRIERSTAYGLRYGQATN